jgi:hypothetical protein
MNFAKGEIAVGGTFKIPGTTDLELGITGEASPTGKFLGVLRGDSLTLREGAVRALLTYYLYESKKPSFFENHFVSVEVAGRAASYDLVRESGTAMELYEERFGGTSVTAYYNAIAKGIKNQGMILGLSAGYGRRNNVGNFDEVEVCTTTPVGRDDSRVVRSCDDVALGEFDSEWSTVVNGDLLIYTGLAGNRIVLGPFFRYDPLKKNAFRPGSGIYIAKKDNLLSFIGGLTVELAGSEPVVGLQVGFPLWGTASNN